MRRRKRGKVPTAKLPRRLADDNGDSDASDGAALSDFEETAAKSRRRLRRAPTEDRELDFDEDTPARRRPLRQATPDEPATGSGTREPMFEEEPEGIRAILLNPLVAWSAAAALLLVAVVLAVTRGGGGLDAEALARFYGHAEAEEFAQANIEIQNLAAPEAVDAALRDHVDRLERLAVRKLRKQANKSFKAKQWVETLQAAQAAAEIEADGDMLFLIAETLRLSEDPASGEAYDQYLATFPKHGLRDDGLFWRAESLAAIGEKARALELFNEIVGMPKSNFKRSAARRIEELN